MSSINPNNINGQYPIAGQDNDSQGFRDNFTNVKNNLTFAKAEIEDLQNNAVLKSALSGTTLNNNLNYAQISAAQLIKTVETKNDLGTKTGATTISWADGNFQYLTTSGNVNLTFTNWPTTGLYARLVLQITTDTTNRTVTFPSAVSVNLSTIQGVSGQVVTLPTAGVYIFELTTYDAGATIVIQDLLRNYNTITGNFTLSGATITGYQYLTPGNASIANVSSTVSTVIIEPATVIAEANIRMPGNTQVVDGQTVSFAFGNTITAVTHYGNGATILGGLTSAGVTTDAKYIFKSSTNTWYRIG